MKHQEILDRAATQTKWITTWLADHDGSRDIQPDWRVIAYRQQCQIEQLQNLVKDLYIASDITTMPDFSLLEIPLQGVEPEIDLDEDIPLTEEEIAGMNQEVDSGPDDFQDSDLETLQKFRKDPTSVHYVGPDEGHTVYAERPEVEEGKDIRFVNFVNEDHLKVVTKLSDAMVASFADRDDGTILTLTVHEVANWMWWNRPFIDSLFGMQNIKEATDRYHNNAKIAKCASNVAEGRSFGGDDLKGGDEPNGGDEVKEIRKAFVFRKDPTWSFVAPKLGFRVALFSLVETILPKAYKPYLCIEALPMSDSKYDTHARVYWQEPPMKGGV